MAKSDELFHVGHRERLKEKLLNGQLADYEKLELLLTYAIPRRDVKPLARKLIAQFKNIYYVLRAPVEELVKVPGIGQNTAILIKLFHELELISYEQRAVSGTYLQDDKFRNAYCRTLISNATVEKFFVLYMGANMQLIYVEEHSNGTIDQTGAYPREIAKKALQLNALSVLLLHNHPVSNNSLSLDDCSLTEHVIQALEPLNITLYDHLVLASNGVLHSYRALPWLQKKSLKS